jgi:hypothetical protein
LFSDGKAILRVKSKGKAKMSALTKRFHPIPCVKQIYRYDFQAPPSIFLANSLQNWFFHGTWGAVDFPKIKDDYFAAQARKADHSAVHVLENHIVCGERSWIEIKIAFPETLGQSGQGLRGRKEGRCEKKEAEDSPILVH